MKHLKIYYHKDEKIAVDENGKVFSIDLEKFNPLLVERFPHYEFDFDAECDLVHNLCVLFPSSNLAKKVKKEGI